MVVKQTKNPPNDKWVWLDLEMTGLNEDKCAILQAAMIITDPQFNEMAVEEVTIWQPEAVLSEMAPFVRDMHTKNGLLKRVRSSQKSVEEAEIQLLATLTELVPFRRGILVGNTIYMDRRFLRRYMPSFESYLHYRQIDVSSIKIACEEWYPEQPKHQKPPSAHTALEDVRESIAELKHYKKKFFRDIV